MPKLPDQRFGAESKSGERLDFSSSVFVDTRGTFSMSVPDVLEATGRPFLEKNRDAYRDVQIDFTRGKARVFGPALDRCAKFIRAMLEDHLAVEISTEDVLAYCYTSGVHYWKTAAGEIFPSGHHAGERDQSAGGNWFGKKEVFANETDDRYRLSFAAFALVKTTYSRPGSTKIVFSRWRAADHWDLSDVRSRLNGFVRLNAPCGEERGSLARFTVIPYSEKAAEFFYQTMIGFCRIDDRLNSFFGDAKKVTAAIEAGRLPLLK